jgi:hypothetical protein
MVNEVDIAAERAVSRLWNSQRAAHPLDAQADDSVVSVSSESSVTVSSTQLPISPPSLRSASPVRGLSQAFESGKSADTSPAASYDLKVKSVVCTLSRELQDKTNSWACTRKA